ncbi:MAG: NAD(P)/FAD-dependent oxidoreductase [Lachnospiraceae bacterium]|nr:NAD(P)/FAD-dependent oxidoreductase [Lachnospiraceae bacterium]
MSRVAVIGGGPAGMMAAVTAAGQGHEVSLWEKNEKTGKKLYITGKGRCNVTNNCDTEEFLQAVCVNRKFLYSAGYGFDSQAVMDFFEKQGLPLKTERGGRVFPVSDHSSDVIAALNRSLKETGVQVHLNQEVTEVLTSESRAVGIRLKSGKAVEADAVIVATGGISYRTTGSTGDGYRFAREAGHQVTELYPSLVPIETAEDDPARMQGLSLRNVEVVIRDGKKELYRGFGEMMFTHFGVTGPLILTASTVIQKRLREHPLEMRIDLKPALDEQQLDARILREFELGKNKQLKNILGSLYPAKMVPVMMDRAQICPEKPVRDITREERQRLADLTKSFPLTITSLRDYNEAIITRGGVNVREIQPSTMESRLVKGLFFAGEVLDLDAVTGGYNLQIAWCTGYAAGMGAAGIQE